MSRPKKIKNLRIIKIITELKNLEDATEEINKIKELDAEIIIQSTKKKTQCYRKRKNK